MGLDRNENLGVPGQIEGQQRRGHVVIGDNKSRARLLLPVLHLRGEISRAAGAIERIALVRQVEPAGLEQDDRFERGENSAARPSQRVQLWSRIKSSHFAARKSSPPT